MRKRVLRRAGVVVATVSALGLLVVLVLWVGDRVTLRRIRQLGKVTSQSTAEYDTAGYMKPLLYDNMTEGNAWEMYEKACDAQVRMSVMLGRNDTIFAYVKKGVRLRRCFIPWQLKQGFISTSNLVYHSDEVASIFMHVSRKLRGSDTQCLLEDAVDCVLFAQDIAGGHLESNGYWTGYSSFWSCWSEIRRLVQDPNLDRRELRELAVAMHTLADSWPILSGILEREWNTMAHNLRNLGLDGSRTAYAGYPFEIHVYWWPGQVRSRSWRYLFFPRTTYLDGLGFLRDMLVELLATESQGWPHLAPAIQDWRLRKAEMNNIMVDRTLDEWFPLYEQRFRAVTWLRLAGSCALLRIYFADNEHWPERLDLMETGGLQDLVVDPFSGKSFRYIAYPEGDSVAVYSVGPNMVDDGGKRDWTGKDDMLLVLHRPTHGQ